jgi:hypothetical protein
VTGRDRHVLMACVEAIAADFGSFNRVARREGEYIAFLAERVCGRVEDLGAMLTPTAADFYRAHLRFGLDEDAAVREALVEADRLRGSLRRRMALDEDGRLRRPWEEGA